MTTKENAQNATVSLIASVVGMALLFASLVVHVIDPLLLNLTYTLLGVGGVALVFALVQSRRRISEAVKSGGTRYRANMLLLSLVVLAILVVINFIAYKNSKRFDLTEEGLFTLSDQTLKVLKNLKDDLNIVAFYSQGNPDEMGARTRLEEILNSFKYESDFIKYRFIDPDKDPVATKNYKITESSPRIIITFKDREERVKDITEEALINGIVRLTREEKKIIYFTIGHGEASLEDNSARGYTELQKRLESEGYKTGVLSLLEAEKVPTNAAAVVIAGPEKPLLAPEEERIKEYMEKGGKLLYMIEPFTNPGLEKVLSAFGVTVNNTIIVDLSARVLGMGANVPIGQQYSTHPITKDFHFATFFPTARSLSEGTAAPGITPTAIVRTSPNAWGETSWQDSGNGNVEVSRDEGDLVGPLSIAVASSRPNIEGEDKYSSTARLIVVGDRDFANNQFLTLSGNADLALNMLAWLAEEEDLISVRPKLRKASRVFLTQRQGNFLYVFAQWVIPVLTLMIGVGIWLVRRRK
ncbi:MAG: hypothetical protein Kow0090_03540 [Myxococcota bacterium]